METVKAQPVAAAGAAPWLILFGVWLIYFCFGLMLASMGPLITPIGSELGISNSMMGLILGAWPLVYIFAAVPCGMLLDRLGARRMLFAASLLMAASGLARGLAETPVQMLLAVGLFGIGGPMISVGAPKVIAGLFEGTRRATAMGIYVTGPYLGSLLSLALTNSVAMPLVGGDWRGVMVLYAAIVASSGVIWLGVTALRGTKLGSDGGKKFNLSAFSEILRVPSVRIILAMSVGIFFFNHALNNWMPEILLSRGMDAVSAGYWASIPAAMGIVGALVIPRFATPRYRLLVMGALFSAALASSFLLHLQPGVLLGTGLVLQGLARGAMMTVAILLLMETRGVPPESLGLAGGLFFTAAEIGGVLGPVTFGILSDASGGFGWPIVSVTFVCLALLLLLAALRVQTRREGAGL